MSIPSQIAKFMGPTWGPPGTCRPQMGPMWAPWTLLSGMILSGLTMGCRWIVRAWVGIISHRYGTPKRTFLISENPFLISEINFWYQKIVMIFWYQKFRCFLISENRFFYIRKYFLISENRISDIRKSALKSSLAFRTENYPDSKIHGANMRPIWGR